MLDNTPTETEWKKLYQKAAEFGKLKPWEWMGDEELFAVKNPETGETAYCCVMGRMGEFLGLAAYLGSDGLDTFFQIQSGQISPDDPDSLYLQRALMVSYEDRDEIEDEDHDIIRKLGLRFRGKNGWPLFRSLRPHYYPWFLENDEAQFLTRVLEQAMDVCQRLKNEPELLTPPSFGQIFIKIPEKTVEGLEWEDGWIDPDGDEEIDSFIPGDDYSSISVEIDSSIPGESDSFPGETDSPVPGGGADPLGASLSDRNELLELEKEGVWEFDFYFYPEVVQNEPNERPYFPCTITWADHQAQEMIAVGLAEPNQWKSLFRETFYNSVEKTQHLPCIIQYEDEELLPLLESITSPLDIRLEEVYELEFMGEARENILEFADEDNPLMELMDRLMEDNSLVKLLELVMEDENLIALIHSGKLDDFLNNEKVQNLIQDNSDDSNGIPSETPLTLRNREFQRILPHEEDKTYQTSFQTDSESFEVERSIYQFRIDLDGIRPPIWRRILIPGTFTLRDLHQAIQDVMGWGDYHLHQFMVADHFSGNPISLENHDEETEKIEDWFAMESPYGIYIYDFGDNWEHILKLEVITRRDEKATYPQCIKGKRACPPEDCGGVGGYLEMLEILEGPEDEEYKETVELLGDDFNPEKFNREDVVFKVPAYKLGKG
jgi:hypothetical protein